VTITETSASFSARVPALTIEGLVKRFGSITAVAGIDLTVARGEFFTLLGPSGSGKTTILRLIAGFDRPSAGRILLDGQDISTLSPGQRGIGVVFQHYALFPHLTVNENIRYPLRLRRWALADVARRIEEMLSLVRLEGLGHRYPRELSGGQQQRVALARALAFRPMLLLMDEPLGALDRTLRVEMEEEIRRIHREAKTSVVYVTHDREEAFAMSDRIGVVRAGILLQTGDARTLFETPVDTFVARFFGDSLLLPVEVVAEGPTTARVRVLGREVTVRRAWPLDRGPSRLVIRPGQVRLDPPADHVSLAAEVADVVYLGETTQLRCHGGDVGQVLARVRPEDAADVQVGQRVRVGFAPAEAICVPHR
jgi:putative spermidine/putrescine transport system ATP-binding protein